MATLRRSASVALPGPARLTRAGPLARRERKLFLAFLAPGLVLSIGAIFLPVLYAIQLSFYHAESFIATPRFVGLANYVQMFSDPRYWHAFARGVLYAVSTVCLQVLIGIGIALLLHLEFRGRNWLRSAAMAPYILPTVVVVYIWKWVLDVNHGLINAALGGLGIGAVQWFGTPLTAWVSTIFVSVWHWTPFVTITFLAALQTVSDDLYDATAVDGANAWQTFIYVTLPVLKPVLVVIVMLRSIFMFNKFDIVWLLTNGGPLTATEHLPILAYQKTFRMFDIGGGAAVATSIFIFLTLLIWIYFWLFPIEEHG
jgi:multiple sugar transport system permease protein